MGAAAGCEAMSRPLDPFVTRQYADGWYGLVTAEDRINALGMFDLAQCRAALEHTPNLQKTVRNRIEARIRKFERQGRTE